MRIILLLSALVVGVSIAAMPASAMIHPLTVGCVCGEPTAAAASPP